MVLRKRHYPAFMIVLLTALAILAKIFFDLDPLDPLEYKVYDYLSRLRQRNTSSQVVILAIDDKSVRHIGSWPWPRSYVAEMVRRLSECGTHTMGVVLLYPFKELNPGLQEIQYLKEYLGEIPSKVRRSNLNNFEGILTEAEIKLNHDEKLISAIRSARNVVLPLRFTLGNPQENNAATLSGWLKMNSIDLQNSVHTPSIPLNGSERFKGLWNHRKLVASQFTEPYDELSRKAGALGHINMIVEADGVVRRMPLLINYQSRDFLSFALQVARKYLGVRLNNLTADGAGLELKNLQIPTDRNYQMFIDYSGQKANIQQYSFIDVLNETVPLEAFQKKIVLLGITAEEWAPRFKTPVKSDAFAIEIEANVVENIINGMYISRPSWIFFLEILGLLYFGIFLLFVIPKVRPRIGALILGIFLSTWIGASGVLFITNGIWLKVLAPVALSMIGFALTSRIKRLDEKRDENVELNKSLGLALQGQGMLDMAFEKFLKCPLDDKSVQELLSNLGLDFERKRMFNKALAVYGHIQKAGSVKDIENRIKKLQNIEKTLGLSAGSSPKETTLFLENGTTNPTLGRYEILKELGHGAMGTVYLGKDPSINREVAIKTLNYADLDPGELKDVKLRFFREAEAAGKLSHPNIVTIYDVGEDHDMAYIAMELLKGKDLSHYCQTGNLLPVNRVLYIVSEVAEALGYAHSQRVVHRDIKPANIILLDNNQVKVADFGIARVMSSSKTQTGVIFGTPSYMSPEQIGGKKVDGRSDLFSLGIVLYEMLAGKKPFTGDSIEALLYAVSNADYFPIVEIAPKTPGCCSEIIDKLLAKGVSKRFKSASQLAADIRACLQRLN
jgi:serine/threonine-protein kinase